MLEVILVSLNTDQKYCAVVLVNFEKFAENLLGRAPLVKLQVMFHIFKLEDLFYYKFSVIFQRIY